MFKKAVSTYFNSWWMPTILTTAILLVLLCQDEPWPSPSILLTLLFLSILSILGASIFQFATKAWNKGLISLGLFTVFGVIVFLYLAVLLAIFSFLGQSEDGFADNLTIPPNIVISEPESELDPSSAREADTYQTAMLSALKSPSTDDPSVTADIDHLVQLHREAPDILKRYLATSPAWRVFKEHEGIFATRRWMIGSHWSFSLHGYYSEFWPASNMPKFQSRFTLGFTGKPWAGVSADSTQLSQGQTESLNLSLGNQMHQSHCVISTNDLVVEIFEQSEARERRLTKAALNFLSEELSPLVENPTWEIIQTLVPSSSIRNGEPSFQLRNSFQPGIYDSEIWVNPGEPGMVYLKAFEVTKGTPLSEYRLKESSNEWIGWSDDPSQLFLYNTHFTIYEGDWGKPYAARFEVWFAPDSGESERKLLEKNFKIEGWQR